MKELTEQQAKELRIVANQIYEELGSGYGYNGPKYRAVAIIELEILSLLSKDQPAKPTAQDIFPIAGPGVRPKRTLTAEEMKSLIEEAKNEDSSPEITSAFELVVVAEEARKYLQDWRNNNSFDGDVDGYIAKFGVAYASAVASKLAREKLSKLINKFKVEEIRLSDPTYGIAANELETVIEELKNKLK